VIFLVFSILIGGLIIGALGRLVVPGPNRIGLLRTILSGVGGSVIGGVIARALYHDPGAHRLVTLVLEVVMAAVLVAVLSGRRPGRWA
jgi:uncharacterized membrane protein YeaQ/YmgE (transglycosylase-associated protein family)